MMARRLVLGLAVASLVAAFAMPSGVMAQTLVYQVPAGGEPARNIEASIDWDNWGVPHITAETPESAFYAIGWAQARGRPDLLLEMMGQGRGRAAELWGEAYFQSDELMWRMGVPQSIDTIYAAQGEEYQRRLDMFAAGINGYFAAHPEAATEARRRVLPVSAGDVLGHGQRALNLMFMAGNELGAFQRFLAEAQAEHQAELETSVVILPPVRELPSEMPEAIRPVTLDQEDEGEAGSNGWAIAPLRSESGNAMLLINPHLPWSGFFTWFETHVTTPEVNAYGAMLIGQPIFGVGFNERLGWTHTVNVHDPADIYRLDVGPLNDGTGVGYRLGFETRPFETETMTLNVRAEDGTLEPRELTLTRSVHGPVIGRVGRRAFAIRIAGLGEPEHSRTIEQYWDMIAADNREEFEAAFSRMQMPMFNMVYADRDGEIAYVSNGLNPVRPVGDAAFWRGMIDGSDPSLIWTEYHPTSALMRVVNPESGFLQNSNEPGWASTIPPALDPADFPADYPPPTMQPRPLHGLAMLTGDSSISYEELLGYARDTRLTLADYVLDDLITLARADGRAGLSEAADVLAAWDRRTELESRGAVLFMLWHSLLPAEARSFEAPWSFSDAATPPNGIANGEAAVEALHAAATQMQANGGIDVTWAQAVRIPDASTGETVPVTLGPGPLGAFWVGYISPGADGEIGFTGGTSFVAAVEFGEQVRARALLPYGNFEQRPDGVDNQLELLSQSRFRAVNFAPEAVAEASVLQEELTVPAAE